MDLQKFSPASERTAHQLRFPHNHFLQLCIILSAGRLVVFHGQLYQQYLLQNINNRNLVMKSKAFAFNSLYFKKKAQAKRSLPFNIVFFLKRNSLSTLKSELLVFRLYVICLVYFVEICRVSYIVLSYVLLLQHCPMFEEGLSAHRHDVLSTLYI